MKILIVDSSPVFQEILAMKLAGIEGVSICGFALDPDDAIQSIRTIRPDLVILDIILNNGNAFDVLKKITNDDCGVKAMILTNYSYQHYRAISMEFGADYFFDKSIEFEKAIFSCKRYISILKEFHKFDPEFSNIHLVPRLENAVTKLEARIKSSSG